MRGPCGSGDAGSGLLAERVFGPADLVGRVHVHVSVADVEPLDRFPVVDRALDQVRQLLLLAALIDRRQRDVLEDLAAEDGATVWPRSSFTLVFAQFNILIKCFKAQTFL